MRLAVSAFFEYIALSDKRTSNLANGVGGRNEHIFALSNALTGRVLNMTPVSLRIIVFFKNYENEYTFIA